MKSTEAFCPCATGKGHDINAVLLDLLAELKGQHVWFKAAGEKVEPYRTVRSAGDDGAFSLDIVEAVIDGSLQSAAKGMLRYGMLEGNIATFTSLILRKMWNPASSSPHSLGELGRPDRRYTAQSRRFVGCPQSDSQPIYNHKICQFAGVMLNS